MNIFFLSFDPEECAEFHCDKHVLKMILEYAQLLSTAHRVLDGIQMIDYVTGRKRTKYILVTCVVSQSDEPLSRSNGPPTVVSRSDGPPTVVSRSNGPPTVVFEDDREQLLYAATHVNHPCSIWTRKSKANYMWLYELWTFLLDQYSVRYNGKIHACSKLKDALKMPPTNIAKRRVTCGDIAKRRGEPFSEPPCAMPDECKYFNAVTSYRNFYCMEKASFATWKNTRPAWFVDQRILI